MQVAPALRLVTPDGRAMTFPADRQVLVGRDPEADIVIPDADVSWHHCELRSDGRSWRLSDLHSTNGTWSGQGRIEHLAVTEPTHVRIGQRNMLEVAPCMSSDLPPRAVAGPGIGALDASASFLVPLVVGVLVVAVGAFALDWYNVHAVIPSAFDVRRSVGLELDADTIGLAATAIGGVLGVLGWSARLPPRLVGLLVICTALISAATAAYLMFGPPADDQVGTVGGFNAIVNVSLAIGGFVTLAGCAIVLIAGFMLIASSSNPRRAAAVHRPPRHGCR